jgi:hypothetical protein
MLLHVSGGISLNSMFAKLFTMLYPCRAIDISLIS